MQAKLHCGLSLKSCFWKEALGQIRLVGWSFEIPHRGMDIHYVLYVLCYVCVCIYIYMYIPCLYVYAYVCISLYMCVGKQTATCIWRSEEYLRCWLFTSHLTWGRISCSLLLTVGWFECKLLDPLLSPFSKLFWRTLIVPARFHT